MRDKFVTRKFLLRGSDQVSALVALIPNLPIDPEKPLEVLIREEPKQRGLDLNGWYWATLTEISEQAWVGGRQYSKEVLHEYAKLNIMPDEIVTKDGVVRSKWLQMPDGSPVAISTTELEKGCFTEYVRACEAWGASLGVIFTDVRHNES